MMHHYTLDADHKPVLAEDYLLWQLWIGEEENRRVAHDEVGEIFISTIFLGLDVNASLRAAPLVFETMIFGAEGEEGGRQQYRYCSWDEALIGHAVAVEWAKSLDERARTCAETEIQKALAAVAKELPDGHR